MNKDIIVKVAVEKTIYYFDRVYDYIVPDFLEDSVQIGCRVLVPFGVKNQLRQAVIVDVCQIEEDKTKLKKIISVLDKSPIINKNMLMLAKFIKNRYFCTLFEALKCMLPSEIYLKIECFYESKKELHLDNFQELSKKENEIIFFLMQSKKAVKRETLIKKMSLNSSTLLPEKLYKLGLINKSVEVQRKKNSIVKVVQMKKFVDLEHLTEKQKKVCKVLSEYGNLTTKELSYLAGVSLSVISLLIDKGILKVTEREKKDEYLSISKNIKAIPKISLTEEQLKAYNSIYKSYKENKENVFLLHGITGSGKTLVFMKLIDQVKKERKNIIVMVPEISLTPQIINIFRERYGDRIAVFHSGMSSKERFNNWKLVKEKKTNIAIGTRSAVFAPFESVGLIIMDEEQDSSYKSESNPRYNTIELAKFRCYMNKATLLLTSATPSIESYYYACKGQYYLYELKTRYGLAKLPQVDIIDMNLEIIKGNSTIISNLLFEQLIYNIQNKEQSILLLNRRGYNTFVRCRSCGEVVTCPYCSISMTYHIANHRLMCHYCGYMKNIAEKCPKCNQNSLYYSGFGTQRLEEYLKKLIPQAKFLRIDADSTMDKQSYKNKFEEFKEGKYDILIGTQMVSKGLDFPNVTLVGVISTDQTLYGDDFRSYEKAFSLITQVVGRAGRRKKSGRAIIQTFTPENPVIQMAAEQNYKNFYNTEIAVRKAMIYPPFADICMVVFSGASKQKAEKAAYYFFKELRILAKNEYSKLPLRVLDPSSALVQKVSNKYRYKIIIKCKNNKVFRHMMSKIMINFEKNKIYKEVLMFIHMNPDRII